MLLRVICYVTFVTLAAGAYVELWLFQAYFIYGPNYEKVAWAHKFMLMILFSAVFYGTLLLAMYASPWYLLLATLQITYPVFWDRLQGPVSYHSTERIDPAPVGKSR